VITGKGPK